MRLFCSQMDESSSVEKTKDGFRGINLSRLTRCPYVLDIYTFIGVHWRTGDISVWCGVVKNGGQCLGDSFRGRTTVRVSLDMRLLAFELWK